MHGNRARAGDADSAAFDGQAGATGHRQFQPFAGGQFHRGVGADQFQALPGLQPHLVALRLRVRSLFADTFRTY